MNRVCLCLLIVALGLCALPASASAAQLVVNSTADTHDALGSDDVCADAGGNCTLRAALEQASGTFGPTADNVTFDASFDGGPEDAITIGSPLPVNYDTSVLGGDCNPAAGRRPCAWVGYASPSAQNAFVLSYYGNRSIRGIAVGNAATAIAGDAAGSVFAANWLGYALDGSLTPVDTGISAPASLVGGPDPQDGNRIAARQAGVVGSSETVQNNWIGLSPETGAVTLAPTSTGIAGATVVERNRVAMSSGVGVDLVSALRITDNWIGVTPEGNRVGGGTTGLRIAGGALGRRTTVTSNVIGNATGPGVQLGAGFIEVFGNFIGQDPAGRAQPNGGPGIYVTPFFSFGTTQFGWKSRGTALPNVIANNGGAGISIAAESTAPHMIGQNFGSGNGGPFIDLGADGPGNPLGVNEGITPQRITGASQRLVRGRSNGDATVYVYLSPTGRPGDLTRALGVATASRTGRWELPVSAVPANAYVAASQLIPFRPAGGSELAMRRVDTLAPDSRIKTLGLRGTRLIAKLTANERGATFRCALDGAALKPCLGTLRKRVKKGAHRLRVVAVDSSGNVERTPSRRSFVVR